MATYLESFTAADGSFPATDTDLTWVRVDGGGGAGWSVTGNQASPNGSARGINQQSRAEHDTTSSDQYAQVVITGAAGAASELGVCVRYASAANTFYMAMFRNAATPWVQIWKSVGGTFTALGAQITVSVALPDTLRIEVEGSTIRAYWNGTLTESITDTSITSGTRAGLHGHENAGQGLGVVVDGFEFGDLSAASPSGGSTSTVTITASGVGASTRSGGASATVTATASGAGTSGRSGDATAVAPVATSGVGTSARSSGASAVIAVATSGTGTKHIISGTSATVTAVAIGGGSAGATNAQGGSQAVVVVAVSGAGSKYATGGAIAVVAAAASGSGQTGRTSGSIAVTIVTTLGGGVNPSSLKDITVTVALAATRRIRSAIPERPTLHGGIGPRRWTAHLEEQS